MTFDERFRLSFLSCETKLKYNRIDISTSMRMAKVAFSDNTEQLRIIREIIKECASVTDVDRCEAAYKIKACGELAAKARGLTLDDF